MDPAYPVCAEKVEFLRARWQSDPCYAFYGVDGTTCSILTYLSQIEGFCPPRLGGNHSALPIPISCHFSLYEMTSSNSGPAVRFMRSRVERMSEQWIQAGLRMRQSQRFQAMVERGGPLGELVQWADLSACLTILGHNLTLSTSHLIGAAPGRGSCPIQRPLTFDLIYTDYHGLAHLQGAMGLAFLHYQCRFRILDSFGTEPAFNLGTYARSHGYKTLWGSWGLQPLQYMTMFPHTPDNSFLGFVSEEAVRQEVREEELEPNFNRKENIAVVYGKQDYMWQVMTRTDDMSAFDFYKGKPTTRQISSQHPYVEDFIGKPYVWTVDTSNLTDVREAVRAILRTEPFTPREFTCEGMLERVHAYITHQNFCSKSLPTWPPEGALRVHLGPLGQSCVSVCRRSSMVCEPALFHYLNSPAAFTRLGLGCSNMGQEVNHLFPAYNPWGRHCGLQQEPLLFSCAGSDPSRHRLCPCRAHLPGQVALCPHCL
uniref:alpha-1,6-mannosyl-glycoprotein 6-beta-N-acetylglucosaminyltransferase n=1 Tax=Myripristis murdjan TaxID=586833 RepID=A0A667XLT9_9TELE